MYNQSFTVDTLAAQAAGTLNHKYDNTHARGIKVFINIASKTGTLAMTTTIYAADGNGNRKSVLATTSLTAAGQTVLTVYPGLTAAANSVVSDLLGYHYEIETVIGGTTPTVTGTIQADLLI